MECLGISARGGHEAELSEYFYHRGVFGQDFCRQFRQSDVACARDEMTNQDRADAAALPCIDDDKCHLGPPRLENNVPAAADDDLAAGFIGKRDNRDMIFKIDVQEEGALLIREVAFHDEEAALQRLCAGLSDRSEHVSLILPLESADFDLAAIAEKLACNVVDRLGHWTSWVGKQEQRDRSGRQMRPVPACGRLIWIKTIAREWPVNWS